ncbi:lipopolysaccharide biosynthesis protein [Pedobacter sp. Leaf250]|uniref:lipopolysaccharide biosynthesis protein n=1 Tax=Pedobacter sp. Leaf250 TaxID=2876559 RepID=UPI001E317D0A|nr:lipopolysaccharide biosynthesis protein [Pedobacter sp. Leaf250]
MKILQKLRNIHFLSLMGTGGMSVLTFLLTAILYRSLSIKEIGIWFFFQSMLSFLDTFRQGFLSTAFVKFYAGSSPDRGQEVIGSTWFIAINTTIILLLLNIPLIAIVFYIKDESLLFFAKYYSLNLICSLPMIVTMCIAQGDLKFGRLMYIRVFQVSFLILCLGFLILAKHNTLTNLMYINILAGGITSMLCLILGWSGIRYFANRTKTCIKEIFDFGKYTVGTSISSSLFGVTDTFVINFMLGPSSLAVYNLGRRLMEVVEIPLRSFVATAMPALSSEYNQGNKPKLISTMGKYIGIITIGLIPFLIGAFIFAGYALAIIGGGKYNGTEAGSIAVNIFRISAVVALLYPADRFLSVTLDAIHKPQINLYKVIIMVVINIITDFAGIYIFGNIYGLVVGTFIPTLVGILISYYYINKGYQNFSIFNSYFISFIEIKKFISNGFKSPKPISN